MLMHFTAEEPEVAVIHFAGLRPFIANLLLTHKTAKKSVGTRGKQKNIVVLENTADSLQKSTFRKLHLGCHK